MLVYVSERGAQPFPVRDAVEFVPARDLHHGVKAGDVARKELDHARVFLYGLHRSVRHGVIDGFKLRSIYARHGHRHLRIGEIHLLRAFGASDLSAAHRTQKLAFVKHRHDEIHQAEGTQIKIGPFLAHTFEDGV